MGKKDSAVAATTGTSAAFCPACRALLPTPDSDNIICSCCGLRCLYRDIPQHCLAVHASSSKTSEPEWLVMLRSRRKEAEELAIAKEKEIAKKKKKAAATTLKEKKTESSKIETKKRDRKESTSSSSSSGSVAASESSEEEVPTTKKSGKKQKHSTRATVDEQCPICHYPQATFYTLQLRSVDEGQTVFYQCMQCDHTWSQNN